MALHIWCAVKVCKDGGLSLAQSKHLCQGLNRNVETSVVNSCLEGLAVGHHNYLPVGFGNQILEEVFWLCDDEPNRFLCLNFPGEVVEVVVT